MRFTFATLLLVSTFLEASALRIPRPPKIPGTPDTPNTPNVPNTPNPPGRLPGNPTPNNPGRLPEENAVSCFGRRRAIACTIDSKKWDDLKIEDSFRKPGASAIEDLDSIKRHPGDAKPNREDIDKKYETVSDKDGFHFSDIGKKFLGLEDETPFFEFVVKNKKENVDALVTKLRDAGDTRDLDALAKKLREAEMLQTQTNTDKGTIVVELSFNRKYDVYRDYDKDGLERPALTGNKDDAMQWTDQVMAGWKKAIAAKDPNLSTKDVELKNIIRHNIATDETNNVIEAAMQKAGQKFGPDASKDEDWIEFSHNGERKEGFEAIAGTIHGKRVIQMLKDYHEDIGKTVNAFLVKRSGQPDGPDKPYHHDMLIELTPLS